MGRALDDYNWSPHVGQILDVVNKYRDRQLDIDIPFVKVTHYKTGQKTFKVKPVSFCVKTYIEMISDTPVRFRKIYPVESSTDIESNDEYHEQPNNEEYICRFSRAQKHNKWIIDINGYISYLREYKPSVD